MRSMCYAAADRPGAQQLCRVARSPQGVAPDADDGATFPVLHIPLSGIMQTIQRASQKAGVGPRPTAQRAARVVPNAVKEVCVVYPTYYWGGPCLGIAGRFCWRYLSRP